MKVAFVFISMPVGGAEDFALTVARHFPAGIAAEFVCLRSLGVIGEELRGSGAAVHLLPCAQTKRWSLRGIWKLARWLKEHGITVVHSQTYHAHTYAIPAARLAGCVSVLHQQKTVEKLRLHRHWMMHGLSQLASGVVALSAQTRRDLARVFHVRENRSVVVPNVADSAIFQASADRGALRGSLRLDPHAFVIGGIASLNEVKNHAATLDMLAALRSGGMAFHALLIGEGKLRPALESHAHHLQLGEVLALPGNQRPIAPWLQALDVLVLPSLWEGQPMILLQAMACGVPIIASRIEGNTATLGAEHPGLFTLGEGGEYAALVRRVAVEADFRSAILTHQQAVLATQPEAAAVALSLVEFYRGLIARRGK